MRRSMKGTTKFSTEREATREKYGCQTLASSAIITGRSTMERTCLTVAVNSCQNATQHEHSHRCQDGWHRMSRHTQTRQKCATSSTLSPELQGICVGTTLPDQERCLPSSGPTRSITCERLIPQGVWRNHLHLSLGCNRHRRSRRGESETTLDTIVHHIIMQPKSPCIESRHTQLEQAVLPQEHLRTSDRTGLRWSPLKEASAAGVEAGQRDPEHRQDSALEDWAAVESQGERDTATGVRVWECSIDSHVSMM